MAIDFVKVAVKWQEKWKNARAFESDPSSSKEGYYIQTAYPYPSGAMHIGHGRTYTVPDAILRFRRMQGFNTLYPMGWHVTGTPVIAQCEKVALKDKKTIDIMTRVFKIPKQDLKMLTEPVSFVNYFVDKASTGYKAGMKKLGIGIDWRRELKTIDPHYSKFISWQYNTLRKKGLVIAGKFPVRYCPHDKNAVGDHDLSEGEGVDIVEYMVYRFRCGDVFLPAATLRPETVFGVTNMWLNPKEDYVVASVSGEDWVVSRTAAEKLKHQHPESEVKVKSDFDVSKIFGKTCRNPVTGDEVPVLPASFVSGEFATGVVMSVPAHAPLDFMAVEDLKKDSSLLEKFGVDKSVVLGIKPVALIKVEGYGEFPAVDVCMRLKVFSQDDPRCEDATNEIYKKEFHTGVLNERTGKFRDIPVSKAKAVLSAEFRKENLIGSFFELSARPVTCRCGTEVVVKILDNQWFVKYSDEKWKKEVRDQISSMQFVPKDYKSSFDYTVGWLENKPCARQKGLGTPIPWDPDWIVEPLGDSTIYMAYFTLSHIVKELDSGKLDDTVFDFVFLKKGDAGEISKRTSVPAEKLLEMQESFDYWYPLRFNCSANELVQNHMSYSIFQHTAIFPKGKRQNGELVLGMGLLEGKKMSSSKGNVILIDDIAGSMGADMVRFFLLNMVEPWQDFDWRQRAVEKSMRGVQAFFSEVHEIALSVSDAKKIAEVDLESDDLWILSKINRSLKNATVAFEAFEVRKAIMSVFFDMSRDFRIYMEKSVSRSDTETVLAVKRYFADVWVRAIAPVTPHVCEEIWSALGNDSFVIDAAWPECEQGLINDAIEKSVELVETVISDIKNICEITGNQNLKKAVVFVSQKWKWLVVKEAMKLTTEKFDSGKVISEVMKNPVVRANGNQVPKFVQLIAKSIHELKETLVEVDEFEVLSGQADYISEQIGCKLIVESGENPSFDPLGKAKNAKPMKPAIYLE